MVAILAIGVAVVAQNKPIVKADQGVVPPLFTSRPQLVMVPVLVTDRNRAHVANLTRDDFVLLENGKEQKIAALEEIRTSAAPVLRVANPKGEFSNLNLSSPGMAEHPRRLNLIVLDLVNTKFVDQAYARGGVIEWLSQSVNVDELTSLLVFSPKGVRIVHDFTADNRILAAALQKVRGQVSVPDQAIDTGALSIPGMQTETNALETLFRNLGGDAFGYGDQVELTMAGFNAIADAYGGVPGRKALIWMTGGLPFGIFRPGALPSFAPESTSSEVVHTYQKLNDANIAVYPVDARGLVTLATTAAERSDGFDPRNPTKTVLQARQTANQALIDSLNLVAEMTGGRAFYNTNDLATAASQAAQDSSAYYLLGYYLKNDLDKPGWRSLHVKVKRSGVNVRSREGFFLTKPGEDDAKRRAADIELALRSPFEFTALPLTVRWTGRSTNPSGNKTGVEFDLMVGGSGITIDEMDNNHVSLEFNAVALDAELKDVVQSDHHAEANLKPANTEKMRASGMTYHDRLALPPGDYTVRFVVRDNLSGRVGSVIAPLRVD